MRGFPRIIQTRTDMERMLAAYPEQAAEYLRRLLDERMHFDDQGNWVENPDSALAAMGISTVEAIAWIGGGYTDPPAPVEPEPDMVALIAQARRGWELRCQDFVLRKDGGDRYAPHHDTAMIEVMLSVLSTPEQDRTPEMLAALDLVNQVRAWKLQVNGQYLATAAAVGHAQSPGEIQAALDAGETALTALDAADPGVSLADLYPPQQ
ncbi:hypothetical protein SAMN05660653_00191 [Desulfonatronum thiosulfatophilum]|uniref:Uncharacterized protein n=1 Tax=Desulfonatronum thiosulfatophilum TaxID=617002 RepID=A0A1G6A6R6_9BACT|nr:hypothetical protein [Desulfonatronum thiosulfatophilum]SDB04092.1 hypothetical protein SAMN05660653_00191 [Desulfonatronum thiosulfatophilum]